MCMPGVVMFKQTQTPFYFLGNWPCVKGGGWPSKLASYAGAKVHRSDGLFPLLILLQHLFCLKFSRL